MLIARLFIVLALLLPSWADGAPWIDIEHQTGEPNNSMFYAPNYGLADSTTSPFSYATNRAFSGSGSVRLNYPPACQTLTTANQCGGSASHDFPSALSEVFWRQYFFMTGSAAFGATNITSDGLFHVAGAYTKMLKIEANFSPTGPRTWVTMGQVGSKNLKYGLENNPFTGGARVINTNVTFADNTWYCIEGHLKMNTPGSANGVAELWVNNNFAGGANDVSFIYGSIPSTTKWSTSAIFRQIGEGNIFYDRTAFSTTRIGCIGTPPPQDTTPPTPPTGLTAQ